jgi:hypothetical protein
MSAPPAGLPPDLVPALAALYGGGGASGASGPASPADDRARRTAEAWLVEFQRGDAAWQVRGRKGTGGWVC